jgi:hypothetical protein
MTPSISSVCSTAPVPASHRLTVPYDADASELPSGEKARELIPLEWPLRVCRRTAPVLEVSQRLTVLSHDADASISPSREKATARTEPEWPFISFFLDLQCEVLG